MITEFDVISGGCLGDERNREIFEARYKKTGRRHSFFLREYRLNERKVLDVGCSYGEMLHTFGPGSVGIDINPEAVDFCHSLGMKAFLFNVDKDRIPLTDFDAVWCSNLLEHLLSPHRALVKLRATLRANGIMILTVPVFASVPLRGILERAFPWLGHHRAQDHVNFFTPETLGATVECAGFRILRLYRAAWAVPQWRMWPLTWIPRVSVVATPSKLEYGVKSLKDMIEGDVDYRSPSNRSA